LPEERLPLAVFDHHPRLLRTSNVPYVDVRPSYGATSTIVWEYLYVAGVEWTPRLATALFYGIRTDTLGLTREACDADAQAYTELLGWIDPAALARIEQAPLPREYYRNLAQALRHTYLHGNLAITSVGEMHRPDMVAELADLLIRMEDVNWAVVMATFHDALIFSVRTTDKGRHAGQLIRRVVGERGSAGGHEMMAAGRIPLAGRDVEAEIRRLHERIVEIVEAPTQGRRLIAEP
jgi:nanoRNase/pAp phosphatase (c-di-AMP/oligoRNAs hydrolase)